MAKTIWDLKDPELHGIEQAWIVKTLYNYSCMVVPLEGFAHAKSFKAKSLEEVKNLVAKDFEKLYRWFEWEQRPGEMPDCNYIVSHGGSLTRPIVIGKITPDRAKWIEENEIQVLSREEYMEKLGLTDCETCGEDKPKEEIRMVAEPFTTDGELRTCEQCDQQAAM